jgi:spore germination protein YaaH
VEIVINGVSKILGRIERTGVTWDDKNRFRPNADVEESTTRETGVSLDWVYAHWKDLPITTGVNTTYRVRPLDHDLWLGRLMVLDRDGASIVYFTDATTITHWRGRAVLDWGLQGIALWSLGQEDMRLYETLEGGLLPANTKRLDE